MLEFSHQQLLLKIELIPGHADKATNVSNMWKQERVIPKVKEAVLCYPKHLQEETLYLFNRDTLIKPDKQKISR